ncbi:MAG: hypothetical protein IKQ97_10910 [Eubacterium sp.]|nr:hypothetical protein [Eubacterium sp.]
MTNEEVKEKYGITKSFGILIMLCMLSIVGAFAITMVGLFRIGDAYRVIIYIGQALCCVLIFDLGAFRFKNRDRKNLRIVLYAYAFLEALRVSMLSTGGVKPIFAMAARFILVLLACCCVLESERMDTKAGEWIAGALIVLEVSLYIVFLLGFPGILKGRLNKFMPLVGVLIACSIFLLQKGKNRQLGVRENDKSD